jgi:hypothetical protein
MEVEPLIAGNDATAELALAPVASDDGRPHAARDRVSEDELVCHDWSVIHGRTRCAREFNVAPCRRYAACLPA